MCFQLSSNAFCLRSEVEKAHFISFSFSRLLLSPTFSRASLSTFIPFSSYSLPRFPIRNTLFPIIFELVAALNTAKCR